MKVLMTIMIIFLIVSCDDSDSNTLRQPTETHQKLVINQTNIDLIFHRWELESYLVYENGVKLEDVYEWYTLKSIEFLNSEKCIIDDEGESRFEINSEYIYFHGQNFFEAYIENDKLIMTSNGRPERTNFTDTLILVR